LIRPGIEIVTPNPKTSGGARWNYLAAWGYALRKNEKDVSPESKAKEFVSALYKNVKILDSGARGATTTFINRQIGDVLITWENEAFMALKEVEFTNPVEIVVPSISIYAEPPVALVDANVDRHKTREVSLAYLQYLYSPEAQGTFPILSAESASPPMPSPKPAAAATPSPRRPPPVAPPTARSGS
jgi:sulfate transport system substrate-binding protein